MRFLKTMFRHKSLIIFGVVVGVVLGSLYYANEPPTYRASADILIINIGPESVPDDRSSSFADLASTHQKLIKSTMIAKRAAARPEAVSLRKKSISDGLRVESAGDQGSGNVLTVSFDGEVPEDCTTIVNAVVDSYQEFLEERYDSKSSAETTKLMVEARDVLLRELREQEAAYRKFRKDSPLLTSEDRGVNPLYSRLSTIELQKSALRMRRTDLESQLASVNKAKDAGRDQKYLESLVANLGLGFEPVKIEMANRDSILQKKRDLASSLQTELSPLVDQETELLKRFGPNYPLVASVQLQIRETRNHFAILEGQLEKDLSATPQGNTDKHEQKDIVQLCLEYLKQELERTATTQQLLTTLYDTEYAVAKEMTEFEQREAEFQRSLSRTQQLYDATIAQLQDASLKKNDGGFRADVITPAGLAIKVKPDPFRVFPMSILLGALLGAFLAVSAEMVDRSFRSSEQIETQLGLPVVGHILQPDTSAHAQLDPEVANSLLHRSLCTFYRPNSAEAEGYRGLRTALFFTNRGMNQKVIQVTSPCSDDGKSTVAANLSISIAQSGKRVLLVDGDLRNPRLDQMFGIGSGSGLTDVIALDGELKDAIEETPIEDLWLLPAGQMVPDPAELLTWPRFGELIRVVREQYDYVVVDSGPLLAVTDPQIVSSQVDGLVLTVRLGKTPRKQAEAAHAMLAALDFPVLGVVANAVGKSEARGYGNGGGGYRFDQRGSHGSVVTKRRAIVTSDRTEQPKQISL